MTNILDYLEASAARVPGSTALADTAASLSYAQLQQAAHRIGSALSPLCPPRCPVAVFMEKSCAAVSAFYGIVSAGCFYTFLDPALPTARLQQILNVLQPAAVITDEAHRCTVAELGIEAPLLLDALCKTPPAPALLAERRAQSTDTDPLYCNFTSGSTGIPKGVAVCHRSVIDFIEQFVPLFGLQPGDVFGCQAPLDFDVSVKDLYSALKLGARVELLPRSYFSFPTKLMDHLDARGVTVLVWAVSALCILSTMKALEYRRPSAIRAVLFSGEVMPTAHLSHWQAVYPDARFVNLYGPTEITCNCTYHIVKGVQQPGTVLPMGVPFPNEHVFLLDENSRPVGPETPGVCGEVCVAGTALALGYYNDPERTAAAFPSNPLNHAWPERIYRTGDLAHYGADGLLYFAGRKDFQVKHMGHRIELGEIDTAASAAAGVERAACLYLADEQKLLLAYCGPAEKRELLKHLRGTLPQFMLPTAFYRVDAMPVTKNGKLDRALLEAGYRRAEAALAAEKAAEKAAKAAEKAAKEATV